VVLAGGGCSELDSVGGGGGPPPPRRGYMGGW
jgi:hypothetical protein